MSFDYFDSTISLIDSIIDNTMKSFSFWTILVTLWFIYLRKTTKYAKHLTTKNNKKLYNNSLYSTLSFFMTIATSILFNIFYYFVLEKSLYYLLIIDLAVIFSHVFIFFSRSKDVLSSVNSNFVTHTMLLFTVLFSLNVLQSPYFDLTEWILSVSILISLVSCAVIALASYYLLYRIKRRNYGMINLLFLCFIWFSGINIYLSNLLFVIIMTKYMQIIIYLLFSYFVISSFFASGQQCKKYYKENSISELNYETVKFKSVFSIFYFYNGYNRILLI